MADEVSFRRAKAGRKQTICLACVVDHAFRNQEDAAQPLTRVLQFSLEARQDWYTRDLAQYVFGICEYTRPDTGKKHFVSVSYEGEVTFQTSPEVIERIPWAGMEPLATMEPLNRGLMGRTYGVRQFGTTLYVCGEGGQLYRRAGDDSWSQVSSLILFDSREYDKRRKERNSQSTTSSVKEMHEEWDRNGQREDSDAEMGEFLLRSFHNINGPSEQEIYLTGDEGGLLLWDGGTHRWIENTPKVSLFGMLVDDDATTWVCGSEGTILRGDARDGFRDLSVGGELSFNTITQFKGRIYLTTNGGFGGPVGLWTYERGRIEPVTTGLSPDIHDIHTVDSADGVLWAVGFKDILCFDGAVWTRIDHPDNPPVR